MSSKIDPDLVFYHSKIVNEAKFIFDFISLVTRSTEMKSAILGNGSFPPNNWVHIFKDFKDIVDVLKSEFKINYEIDQIRLIENVKNEILTNMKYLLCKHKEKILNYSFAGRVFLEKNSFELMQEIRVSNDDLSLILAALIPLSAAYNRISYEFLHEAIISGLFLEYDKKDDRYRQSEILNRMLALRNSIKKLISSCEAFKISDFIVKTNSRLSRKNDIEIINTSELAGPINCLDRWGDVITLSKDLYFWLCGKKNDEAPKLNPYTPFQSIAAKYKEENITEEDIENFLNEGPL